MIKHISIALIYLVQVQWHILAVLLKKKCLNVDLIRLILPIWFFQLAQMCGHSGLLQVIMNSNLNSHLWKKLLSICLILFVDAIF